MRLPELRRALRQPGVRRVWSLPALLPLLQSASYRLVYLQVAALKGQLTMQPALHRGLPTAETGASHRHCGTWRSEAPGGRDSRGLSG